jgi:hypothetical protein
MRSAVMMVTGPEDFSRFLARYGDPGINPMEYVGTRDYRVDNDKTMTFFQHVELRTHKVFLSQFLEFQGALRRAIDTNVESWDFRRDVVDLETLLEEMVFELKISPGKLIGVCTIHNLVRACFASLFLEKVVEGVEYSWCQECGEYFPRETRHSRKYCGSKCGAKAALRAFRLRKAAKIRAVKARLAKSGDATVTVDRKPNKNDTSLL